MSVRTPKYRLHKGSGQALVQIDGRRIYLGKFGTEASKEKYRQLVAEWLANGQRSVRQTTADDPLVVELTVAYLRFAATYYRKNGQLTDEIHGIRAALRPLRRLYGHSPASKFGPIQLCNVRDAMINAGNCRKYVNNNVGRIKRVFRWAVANEYVPPSCYHALQAVAGLKKGRSPAKESAPVRPVSAQDVQATLPFITGIVRAMVEFQVYVGCRPNEVCIIRPCDVDTSGDVWEYRPESHKTEHHGRERVIFIGPNAQNILRPYLLRPADNYCFSPVESEQKRRTDVYAQRLTPISQGNKPGTNRQDHPKRKPGNRYTVDSYRRAIQRACDLAFPPPEPLARCDGETVKQRRSRLTAEQRDELKRWQAQHCWSPNQLRHSVATDIRRLYGLEAAQVVLGHSNADVTQIYAERDLVLAKTIMRDVG